MHFIWLNLFMLLGGIAGGLLSSIASMASLVSYPVLLMIGVPPLFANVTNDAALIWTGIGSTTSSLKELRGHWRRTLILSLFTTIGSAIGCWLLLAFPSKIFTKVVPFFIAFSGVMILVSDRPKKDLKENYSLPVKLLWLALLLIMGMYAGYFGAASGVVVLIVLTYLEKKGKLPRRQRDEKCRLCFCQRHRLFYLPLHYADLLGPRYPDGRRDADRRLVRAAPPAALEHPQS